MTADTTGTAVLTLPTPNQILMTREFNAPKHLVWKASTTPELIKRWWSGGNGEVTVAEVDLRVGGAWRYVIAASGDSPEVGFHGEYREIVENERIMCTEVFEGAPGEPALTTYTFEEQDGRTTLSVLTEVSSQEVRDMIIATGMESGAQRSWDELEKVAVSLM